MNKKEFYRHYIPALLIALERDDECEDYFIRGPEHYIQLPFNKKKEIDLYLDKSAGKDLFLDKVAYYFDAKSHGFNEINGIDIKKYKEEILKEISLIVDKVTHS